MPFRISIRIKLILAFFLVSIISIIAVIIPVARPRVILEKENRVRLLEAERELKTMLAWLNEEAERLGQKLAEDKRIKLALQHGWKEDTEQLLAAYRSRERVSIVELLTSGEVSILLNRKNQKLIDKPTILSLPSGALGEQKRLIVGTIVSVYDKDKRIGGIVAGYPLDEKFCGRISRKTRTEATLIDMNTSLAPAINKALFTEQRVVYTPEALIEGGVEYQARFIPLIDQYGKTAAIFFLGLPKPVMLGVWEKFSLEFSIALCIGAIAAFIAAYIVSRRISRPINQLAAVAHKVAAGDLKQKFVVKSRDEVGELAKAISTMTQTLGQNLEELHNRADMIEQKNIELDRSVQEIRRMQNYTENILRSITSGVITIDFDKKVTKINQAAKVILRMEMKEGDSIEVLIEHSEKFKTIINEALNKGIVHQGDEIVFNYKEQKIIVEVTIAPLRGENKTLGLVITFRDLTKLKSIEEQMVRQDRLAALGRLSAGVAHEVRNPLGIIKGSAEILKKRSQARPEEANLLDFIIDETKRLNTVVSDLLQFSRPASPELEEADLEEVIKKTLQLLQHQMEQKQITLKTNFHSSLPKIFIDPKQCQQVFLNLILNALEATECGGKLEVNTQYTLESGQILIEIIDNGCGMPPEMIEHIFDPFVTFKEAGTGLGLSIVHRIIDAHNGHIEVESEIGKGSCFRVVFPVNKTGDQ